MIQCCILSLVIVRDLMDGDREWLRDLIESAWGLPIVTVSGLHYPDSYPGFVVEENGERLGAVTYRFFGGEYELVTLNSVVADHGVGSALLHALRELAQNDNSPLWLITIDNNATAIRFFEHQGMTLRAKHDRFVDVVRRAKPQIDATFRDAYEYAFTPPTSRLMAG